MALALWAIPCTAQEQPDQASAAGEPLPVPQPPPDANLPEVEPIINEEEFERTVPDLDSDAELEGELESIEEFERRLAAEQADAEPTEGQQAPLGDPALADGDTSEEIGDAPITDTELAQPLPPLESFEVEPVEFAEDEEDDEEEVEVAYSVRVNGLEEADAETETDLRAMFESLSALEDGDGEAANVAQISARLTEDSALMQRILSSEGWFEAQANTRLERGGDGLAETFAETAEDISDGDASPDDDLAEDEAGDDTSTGANAEPLQERIEDQELVAVIDVVPGTRYTFADIVIDAPAVEPADLITRNLALQVGEPIVAQRVQGAEANVAVALPANGYPFVEVGQRDILLDQDTGDGVYTLPIDPGPRSVFGGIRTTGNLAFDADHIETLARFERGELYDSQLVDDLRQALVATGLFNTVSVLPEESGEPAGADAPEGTQYATLVVDQDAGPPRSIGGSVGYGTGRGFLLEGSWTHRNLFPPEGALIVNGVAGTQEQGAGVTFRRSNAGRRDRTVQFSLDALRADYDAYEAFTARIGGLVSYSSTPIWQKRFTYAYGGQLVVTNEQDFNIVTNQRERRTFYIAGLTGQAGFDTTNDLLDPVEGFRLTALVEPEGSLEDGFTPYVRARLDGSSYLGVGDSIVFASRVRLGTIQGIDRFDLAPSRRFYAGGGGSVRGFGFQELGPRVLEPNPDYPDPEDVDPDDEPGDLPDPFIYRPIGGRSLFEAAAEVRYRFGNFGVVGFVDAGQVYEDTVPTFSDIRYGVGVGGRYYTNFGPLRFDVAMPLNRRLGESAIAVYVSIGQAF